MQMIKKTISAISLSLLIFTSSALNIYADSKYNKSLIEGSSKEISMKLNKSVFEKADEAIFINEESLVDAISVTSLAYAKDAPIITTKWKNIDKKTLNYIEDLGVKKITIIGGLRAVSRTSERDLQEMGIEVERISGADRYETSLQVATELNKMNDVSSIFVINSRAGLENALSIYSYAAQNNMPIIWSNDDDFKKTKSYIKKNNIEKVYAIGDSEKFTDEITKSIEGVELIKEINKSDTNTNLIKQMQKGDIKDIYAVNVTYGNRSDNTECISLGVVAAKQNIPIMISSENFTYAQEKFLDKNNIKDIIQVGTETKDYSVVNTLMSKSFISASILIALITLIVFRAFKYQF